MQGLASATTADKVWILICALVMAAAGLASLLLGVKVSKVFFLIQRVKCCINLKLNYVAAVRLKFKKYFLLHYN